ncbi:MAG: hypothetical protein ACRD5K_17230 [Candidatus Acidiferrales bacterium]
MKRRHILWLGWLLYAASFVMVAGGGAFGFAFADWALTIPWGGNPFNIFYTGTFQHLAILIAGWINPVFLIAAAIEFRGRNRRAFAILRTVVILMIPSCLVVSHVEGFYFREGFYAWILGMLLVMFSKNLRGIREKMTASPAKNPGLPQSN